MYHEVYDKEYLDFYNSDKCTGDLGEKWCTFKWYIDNLHLNPRKKSQSPVFSTRLLPNTYWYLDVKVSLPSAFRALQVSLRRLQKDEENVQIVDVIYKVMLLEEIKMSDKTTLVYKKETEKTMNDRYDYTVSFQKLKKGFMTIECKLRPNKCMVKGVCHDGFDEKLPVNLRKLLQSGELCDTIIQVGGDQRLMAHFAILSARLPKLLPKQIPTEFGKRVIKINDLSVSEVKELLKYAYTGQAYIELEPLSAQKKILAEYSRTFSERCCWDDNPFARTFFNYETDYNVWHMKKDIGAYANIGCKTIELLRIYPNKLTLSVDIFESEEDKKGLTLTIKYCGKEMPKSTLVSCNYFLSSRWNDEKFLLGEFETLLHSKVTEAKVKLCSLAEVRRGMSTLNNFAVLKTEYKFCYGSSKSSIENLYQGHFDITRCTSCALLRADLENLYLSDMNKDIVVKSGGNEISAHKAILVARWEEAEKYEVNKNSSIEINGYSREGLNEFLQRLYTGTAST